MSFRFNFDISFDFPPPPPRSSSQPFASGQNPDGTTQEIKRGLPGWLQTARLHPHSSLRLLYFITSLAGIILDNLVLGDVWHYYTVVDIHRTALAPLIIGFIWQIITVYDKRLFHGRQIPNWTIAIVETLGFLAFLALFVGNRLVIIDNARYHGSLALGEILLIAYDSAVWVILCLVNGILAVQCYVQGWRNVRSKRAACPDCERVHGKGKAHATDDEEALIGDEEAGQTLGGAGPSEQTAPSQYRDEV
ncbi:MAG: hypothetical protein Q9209_005289 [Squamulea sp. 1 TL-2023]